MLCEQELIQQCKAFNPKAQQQFYERFFRKMKAVCYQYVGSKEDAMDLLHDGFIKAFSKIHQFNGVGSLEGWVRRIMINTAIDFLNKKNDRLEVSFYSHEETIEGYSEEELYEVYYSQEEIKEAILLLDEEYQKIIFLYCFEKHTHRVIGEILGFPENTCRSKLRRARKQLKKNLKNK
jgi:RNA polymerase sigma factor (sigma-70 family)